MTRSFMRSWSLFLLPGLLLCAARIPSVVTAIGSCGASSCEEWKSVFGARADGVYTIRDDVAEAAFDVFCGRMGVYNITTAQANLFTAPGHGLLAGDDLGTLWREEGNASHPPHPPASALSGARPTRGKGTGD